MSNTSFAAQAVASNLSAWLAVISIIAWAAMLAMLIAPAWRLAMRRARPLDALWSMLLLGVGNRLVSDAGIVPVIWLHVSAILLAATLTLVIRSYQNADR